MMDDEYRELLLRDKEFQQLPATPRLKEWQGTDSPWTFQREHGPLTFDFRLLSSRTVRQ